MAVLWQDICYGFRMLMRNPGFSFVVVVLVAVGIGVNTTVFSLLNAYLFRPPPYERPDRIVIVRGRDNEGRSRAVGYVDYLDWHRRVKSFDQLSYCGFRHQSVSVTTAKPPERCSAGFVSGSFFTVFPARPFVGRLLSEEDDDPSAVPAVVISHAFWQRHFGADPSAVGRSIILRDRSHTIVGVTRPGFQFPPYGGWAKTDVWVPANAIMGGQGRGNRNSLYALGRLKAGVNIQQAQVEMETICAHLAEEYPASNAGMSATVMRLQDYMTSGKGHVPTIVMGTVLTVFLVACANAAGLLFARGVTREREMALRSALGAARLRLMRLMLLENVVLALLGGCLGVLGATWAIELLARTEAFLATRIPAGFLRLDGRVLGFALALSILAVPLFGLLSSVSCSRVSLAHTLAAGGRNVLGSRGRNVAHGGLLGAQVALTIALLVAAGLMMRSLVNVVTADPGFNAKNVLLMNLELSSEKYAGRESRLSFYRQLLDQLRAIPAVEKAGLDGGGVHGASLYVEGEPVPPPGQTVRADYKIISPGYFETMEIPLLRGRYLDQRDDTGSAPVAIVNETLVRRYWPEGDPIGKRLHASKTPDANAPWIEIVGVVGDVKNGDVEENPPMQVYRPLFQQARGAASILIRTKSDPKGFIAAVRDAVYQIDREQLVCDARTLEEVVWWRSVNHRQITSLLTVFAGIALSLSAAGIYAITRYSVSRRTQEFGIRMALGADRNDVLKLVLRRALVPVLIGTCAGLVGTIAVARVLSSLLYQLSPWDPATYAAVSLLLVGVALLASYIPARRAAKIDPMVALRYE
ncbi:ABC transporter permease [Planctomycetota bacterium]